MADTFSTALATEVVRYFFTTGAAVIPRPTAWYLGLCTDAAGTTEFTTASFASYKRQAATFGLTGAVAANVGTATWTADAGSTPPAIQSVGIYDALTGGNLLGVALVPVVTWAAGESATFAAKALTVQVL